jgi:hypothetical protein
MIVMFAALSVALTACSDEPQHHCTLLEVIDVSSTCYEDHVRRADDYTGEIVRWRTDETRKVSTYGYVTNTSESHNIADEVNHPTVYHTPLWSSSTTFESTQTSPNGCAFALIPNRVRSVN